MERIWIDVKYRMPPENISVMVIDKVGDIWIMNYSAYDGWHCPEGGWSMDVTHWMELPKPPNVA